MHILKNQLGSGEISELLEYRSDAGRNYQGCLKAENAITLAQFGLAKRQGTKYVMNLSDKMNTEGEISVHPRWVPFVFNESQAYAMCFYPHSSGTVRVLFFTGDGAVEDTSNPGNPYIYEITGTFDYENFDYAQSGDTLFIAQSGREPLKFVRTDIDDWNMTTVAFVDQPTDWSAVFGWPELVALYEQRLVFAANLSRPQALWFSKAGDFTNFGVSGPIVDSDAITLTLDTGQQNRILWLSASQRLLVGTVGSEWSISGSGGPITPTSILARKSTNQGSEKLKPHQIGPVTLFLEKFGKTVNQLVYDFNINSYNVVDLSILSPHLTRSSPIVRWGYQKDPGNILWAIREDGVCLTLTYQREHGVLAWTPQKTEGRFIDAVSIPGNDESEVWFTVLRNIDGIETYYIEKLAPNMDSPDLEQAKFVDSYIEYSGVPVSVISGLGHLEGKEVQILGDEAVVPPETVTGGQITLTKEVSRATIGLPYCCDIIPIMPDAPDVIGTLIGRNRKLDQLVVMLWETVLLQIGTFKNGVLGEMRDVPFRNETGDPQEPLQPFTGLRVIDQQLASDRETRILIRHKEPLPFTLLGLIYRITVQDK